jgi:hypothetical protein
MFFDRKQLVTVVRLRLHPAYRLPSIQAVFLITAFHLSCQPLPVAVNHHDCGSLGIQARIHRIHFHGNIPASELAGRSFKGVCRQKEHEKDKDRFSHVFTFTFPSNEYIDKIPFRKRLVFFFLHNTDNDSVVSSLNFMVDSGQLTNVENAIDLASLNFMVNRNFQIF